MSAERQTWKTRLHPFADAYAEMSRTVDVAVQGMTDDELDGLLNATTLATQTNCWWAMYQVAALVAEAVKSEQRDRIAAVTA